MPPTGVSVSEFLPECSFLPGGVRAGGNFSTGQSTPVHHLPRAKNGPVSSPRAENPDDEEHDQRDEDHQQRDGDGPLDIADAEFQINAGGQHFRSLPRRAGEHKDRTELTQ